MKEAWADKFLLPLNSALVKHHGVSYTRSCTSTSFLSTCTATSLTRSRSQSQTQSGSVQLPPGTESRKREWPHFLANAKSFLWGSWVISWQPDDSCVSGLGWCQCHFLCWEEPCLLHYMCRCSPGDWGWMEPSAESPQPAAWPRTLKDRRSHSVASLSAACCTSRIVFSEGERQRTVYT